MIRILLIVLLVGLTIYIIYELKYSVKLKLQTINFYSGGLGSGKTLTGVKTGIKLRNRSVFAYKVFNKHFKLTHSIITLILLLILSRSHGFGALVLLSILVIYLILVFTKFRKNRKNYFIREIYSNFPIYLYTKKIRMKKGEKTEDFIARIHRDYPAENSYLVPRKPKQRYIKIKVYSKALKKGHILGTAALPGACIVILDEASQIFPNENKKTDLVVDEAFRWFRHHTTFKLDEKGQPIRDSRTKSGILIMMDQSIGSMNIGLRRRVNLVYNLSSFSKFLWFYKIDVDRIKYAEDVITNTNDINNWECYHVWGILGKKRYDSCYHRQFYKPDKEYESMWTHYEINPLDPNANYAEQGFTKKN